MSSFNGFEGLDNLLNSVMGPFPTKMPDPRTPARILFQEPQKIDEAIEFYTKRISALEGVRKRGFSTLSDYNEYKKAEEIVNNHKKKMEEKMEEKSEETQQ